MKNILNIINFARYCEPRDEDDSYLFPTLEKELELSAKYGFPTTVLLQYDALIDSKYRNLVAEYGNLAETGLWLEIVQPLVEKSGIVWNGRFPWDWHNDVGFTIGYSPDDRKKLIDTAFEDYREFFGKYPEVAGSWHIDSFSLGYIQEKYGLKAFCLCKEQYGTDGYTIWGGYYNGAYYACRNNIICPASNEENQIDIPVFRMLGPDPIYQYDMGMDNPEVPQGVSSLEPVYRYGGGDRKWVEWYLRENYNGKGLALSYSQTGQENSFGWKRISEGLQMQFELINEKVKNNEIELMTLGDAGEWFRNTYKTTPASAICADSDYTDAGCRTLWYSCRNYRTNLIYRDGRLWIRDLYLFNDRYKERYLHERNTGHNCGYYNLPVVDGFRFSSDTIRAGLFFFSDDMPYVSAREYYSLTEDETSTAGLADDIQIKLYEDRIEIMCGNGIYMSFVTAEVPGIPYVSAEDKIMNLHFDGYDFNPFDYSLKLLEGSFRNTNKTIDILPESGRIVISTICQR